MFNGAILKRLSGYISPLLSNVISDSTRRISPPVLLQAATITSKHFRDRNVKKPAPWPYKEKKFSNYHMLLSLDNTMARFDENTHLIVVEGNIGSGKTEFAKKVADELEMLYFPEPTVDSLLVDPQGNDIRQLDHLMPDSFKSCDLRKFYEDPRGPNTFFFQFSMYVLRLEQYLEALAHILNTGQGVVLERCVFSDFVFVETLHKMGYFSSKVLSFYNEARANSIHDIDLKPTLVIYLDTDVDTILQRIRKRNIDYEVNSKLLNKEYLSNLEHFYKQEYLKDISKHSELLIYDWSQFGDIEAVIDDIEKIDFMKYDRYDLKLQNWRHSETVDWDEMRILFTNKRDGIIKDAFIPRYDCPEILAPPDDIKELNRILTQIASYKYAKGFNPYFGDKGILFKMGAGNYWDKQKFSLYGCAY